MRRPLLAAIALLLVSHPAAADTPAPCTRGLDAEAAGTQSARAHFWLEQCLEADPADAVRVQAKKALRRLTVRLREGSFAEVAFISEPEGATLAIAALELRFAAPRTLWLPFGKHEVAAELDGYEVMTQRLEIGERERLTVVAALRKATESSTGAGSVDFSADPPSASTSRKQQAEEFDSLLPDRFGAGGGPVGGGDVANDAPRWPLWVTGLGVGLAAAAAVTALATDEDSIAIGLGIGGGAALAGGIGGLVITRW